MRVEGGRLVLAMSDLTNLLALDGLKALAGRPVRPVVATEENTRNFQECVFGLGEKISEFLEADEGPMRPQADDALSVSRADDEGAPAVQLANSIIRRALAEGASDIHVGPRAEEFVVRYRVDGVLKRVTGVPLRLKDSLSSDFTENACKKGSFTAQTNTGKVCQ